MVDEKTTDLLVEYFKNSTEAVKEVVTQLNKFNNVISDLSRKIEDLENGVDGVGAIDDELKEISKEIKEYIKIISEDEKLNIEKYINDSKDSVFTKISAKSDMIIKDLGKNSKSISDIKIKLITSVSIVTGLIIIIMNLISKYWN